MRDGTMMMFFLPCSTSGCDVAVYFDYGLYDTGKDSRSDLNTRDNASYAMKV
jgi:hypothetical protein